MSDHHDWSLLKPYLKIFATRVCYVCLNQILYHSTYHTSELLIQKETWGDLLQKQQNHAGPFLLEPKTIPLYTLHTILPNYWFNQKKHNKNDLLQKNNNPPSGPIPCKPSIFSCLCHVALWFIHGCHENEGSTTEPWNEGDQGIGICTMSVKDLELAWMDRPWGLAGQIHPWIQ